MVKYKIYLNIRVIYLIIYKFWNVQFIFIYDRSLTKKDNQLGVYVIERNVKF